MADEERPPHPPSAFTSSDLPPEPWLPARDVTLISLLILAALALLGWVAG